MKKVKIVLKFIRFICFLLLTNIVLFIGLMQMEVFPKVQATMVTSVMVTMSHQYLANLIASKARINEIMASNKVIETDEKTDKNAIKIETQNSNDDNNTNVATSKNENVSDVELIDVSGEGYKGHMFIVHNPKKVILGTTSEFGEYGTKLNDIITNYKGIGGINASGFVDTGGHGHGGTPTGIVIENGEIKWKEDYSSYSLIGIDNDGVLILGNYSIEQIKNMKIKYGISFSPFLIVNGKPTEIIGDGGWGINPRSAIGQTANGSILLLEIDGRQIGSIGVTIKELQNLMIKYGAVNAANLDGGSSTVMYYQDKLINKPCSPYGERPIPDAWIIK